VLEGADVSEDMLQTADDVIAAVVAKHTQTFADDWDLTALWADIRTVFPTTLTIEDFADVDKADELIDAFIDDAHQIYENRQEELGEDNMREFERQVWLSVLDRKWREHLYEMDYLREGIGLRAMAQRDPLVEYKREGAMMYDAMRESFREDVVGFLFNANVQIRRPAGPTMNVGPTEEPEGLQKLLHGDQSEDALPGDTETTKATGNKRPTKRRGGNPAGAKSSAQQVAETAAKAAANRPVRKTSAMDEVVSKPSLTYSGPGQEKVETKAEDPFKGVGRNQLCPCGSGKKFKNCHGKTA
jgi:preprotein translocase subunit SecA